MAEKENLDEKKSGVEGIADVKDVRKSRQNHLL